MCVAAAQAKILGPEEVYVKKGSTISLTCTVNVQSTPPSSVSWHHGGAVVDFDSPRYKPRESSSRVLSVMPLLLVHLSLFLSLSLSLSLSLLSISPRNSRQKGICRGVVRESICFRSITNVTIITTHPIAEMHRKRTPSIAHIWPPWTSLSLWWIGRITDSARKLYETRSHTERDLNSGNFCFQRLSRFCNGLENGLLSRESELLENSGRELANKHRQRGKRFLLLETRGQNTITWQPSRLGASRRSRYTKLV